MSKPISYSDYWNEVSDLAREILDECEDSEQHHDRLHETVDGHQWIIYTYYNTQVLQHCGNQNAYFDDFGPLDNVQSFSDVTAKLAYAAMYQDVAEKLAELEAEPEDESEQEDASSEG